MKRVTITDIARSLNISRNTVSKVLNGSSTVSEETTIKVIKKAIELGYPKIKPELIEKVRSARENKKVAILIKAALSEFWIDIINGISNELGKYGYSLFYNYISDEDEKNLVIPLNIANHEVDGLIVLSVFEDEYMNRIKEYKLPTVYYDAPLNADLEDLQGDVIFTECEASVYKLTKILIEKGLTPIGFIGDTNYCKSIYERWLGFEKALKDSGLDVQKEYCITEHVPFRYYVQEEIDMGLEKMKKYPRAFVCANDDIAIFAMRYLKEKGYKIPQDIAIVGFDNLKRSVLVDPPLTTVNIDKEAVGRRLAQAIVRRIENNTPIFETVRLSTQIIIRGSC
ncbi:transcriptional regulator, LacI family [Caldicellulosiruptor obsidiansis OB47]|uniref:Transcriptional regulator, LacI family n=1 Tax=Caldicellulosiruptor obsidiansis (strain ATCC BAA-2073 / JCM 16842 / OB47) TaxID=608506 RepID=D9THG5_CALOO|nr:LacI family DNA-binding transcriptional regulator [Caldicellulosiruptor obsidiansis]ADL41530.1 transcriptional regulator, LacI family [Caldicellulosiruptor obsidiansis OB47]